MAEKLPVLVFRLVYVQSHSCWHMDNIEFLVHTLKVCYILFYYVEG